MSEATQHQNIDPVEEVLAIEAPTVNDGASGSKKKFSIAKIGVGILAVSVVALAATQYFGQPAAKTTGPGAAVVRVPETSTLIPTPSSAISTRPEAIALGAKTAKEREAEILKDPTKSYVTADPFGDSSKSSITMPSAPKVDMQPIPAPPPIAMPSAPTQQQGEDPVTAFGKRVFSQATAMAAVGVTPANPSAVAAPGTAAAQVASALAAASATAAADISAGDLKYAMLTSGLNSRVPQTVPRAVIHGGAFDGAVLIGAMESVDNHYLVLKFHAMTLNKRTYAVEAIAVNPDMQDAGLADDVQSHVLQRTAIQAGVGFIQSFGASKLQEGTASSSFSGTTGSSFSTSTAKRSNGQTALIALGGAAQAVAPAIDQAVNDMKPEVIVHPGKEMGVLFTKPVFLK
jgi:hypothetical protein